MSNQTRNSMLLMLCALIWGFAFVAQSAGAGLGPYTFLAGRSWLAVLVLLPTVYGFDAVHRRRGEAYGWPKEKAARRTSRREDRQKETGQKTVRRTAPVECRMGRGRTHPDGIAHQP